jgi:hypothetical protein
MDEPPQQTSNSPQQPQPGDVFSIKGVKPVTKGIGSSGGAQQQAIHKKLSLLKKNHPHNNVAHTTSGTSLEDTPSSRNIIQPNNPINGRLGSNIMQTNGTQIATTSFGVRKVSDNNSNINN